MMLKKLFKIIMWIFLALIGAGILGAIFGKPPQNPGGGTQSSAPGKAAVETAQEERVTVTADGLTKAYNENTVAADLKFKGKKLRVQATVSDIATDLTGSPYLSLASANMFQNPQASFDKEHLTRLADTKKGQKVVLFCVGAGDIVKTAMLKKCEFGQ